MSSAQDEFDALYNNNRKEPTHSHPEDAASSTASDDSLTLNDDDQINSPSNHHYSPSMPSATYTLPAHTFDANTGPKGVIADARSFETAKKRSFRQTLHAFSNGQSTLLLGGSKQKKQYEREKSASPDISADDDEDDFMRSWRAKRLDELANMNQDLRTRRQSPSQRKYGTLLAVDPSGYLDAVEKVPSDTTVVVLIYDDEVCIILLSPIAFGNEHLNNSCCFPLVNTQRGSGRCLTDTRSETCYHPLRQATPVRRRNGRDCSSGHPGLQRRGLLCKSGLHHERIARWSGDEFFSVGDYFAAVGYPNLSWRQIARR